MKMCSNVQGHMTKMAFKPIYINTLKKVLLQNQEADDIGTWYKLSSTQVLPNWFTDTGLTLSIFYDMVKCVP